MDELRKASLRKAEEATSKIPQKIAQLDELARRLWPTPFSPSGMAQQFRTALHAQLTALRAAERHDQEQHGGDGAWHAATEQALSAFCNAAVMAQLSAVREELVLSFARQDSAEDFCRLKTPRCTAMDWIFIPYCFAIP